MKFPSPRAALRRLNALVLFWVLASPIPSSAIEMGATFPAFSSYHFDGELPDLAGKVVVVDFWASWCAPCKASFPHLSAVQNEFGSRGLVVLGISVDEKRGDFEQFKKRFKPSFSILRETDHRIANDLSVPAMPTTLVLDRSGHVRFIHAGFHDDTPARLHQEIVQLLDEKS
jgi:thiol-disulfide isomerase/thioredoxin